MPHEIESIDDTLISVRISGVMKVSDQARLQSLAKDLIGQGKEVRVLAKLENFQGWEKTERWDDISFLSEHGNAIGKIAIVGVSGGRMRYSCSRVKASGPPRSRSFRRLL